MDLSFVFRAKPGDGLEEVSLPVHKMDGDTNGCERALRRE